MNASKPTLVLVITEDWYLASHRLPIIRAAVAAGWRVVAATRVQSHGEVIREAGAELVPLSLSREGRNPASELSAITELRKLYATVRPDVVHHVGVKPILYGGWAARMAGVSGVVQAFAGMGAIYTDGPSLRRAAFESAVRPVMGRSGVRVLVQNEADAALLIERRLAGPQAIRIIRGSGVDLLRFAPSPEPDGAPVVVMPARLLRDKGIAEFVAAAKQLRGAARFVLVGAIDTANPSAISEATVRGWVDDGVVEWWGHRADMPAVFAEATVVVLPSYREGLPKALLEAAASGRAIVTTDVPGCHDVVRNGINGLLVPARDGAALATAIGKLLGSSQLRTAMALASRRIAEHEFSDVAVAAETVALYHELLR